MDEQHYTVDELANLWALSHDTITNLFRDEPGVLRITPARRRGVRTRITIRIPRSVAERVYNRLECK